VPAVATVPDKERIVETASNGTPVAADTGTAWGALIVVVAPAICGT